jgi:hypothetical protein
MAQCKGRTCCVSTMSSTGYCEDCEQRLSEEGRAYTPGGKCQFGSCGFRAASGSFFCPAHEDEADRA